MRPRIVWYTGINASKERNASIFSNVQQIKILFQIVHNIYFACVKIISDQLTSLYGLVSL
jgi:hypothetical protein